MDGVGHTDYEGAVVPCGHQAQHDPLIECQGLPLLHLDSLLIKTLGLKMTHSGTYGRCGENSFEGKLHQ